MMIFSLFTRPSFLVLTFGSLFVLYLARFSIVWAFFILSFSPTCGFLYALLRFSFYITAFNQHPHYFYSFQENCKLVKVVSWSSIHGVANHSIISTYTSSFKNFK